MFSLVLSILSIALVAALALATIYYGGSVFAGTPTDKPTKPRRATTATRYRFAHLV